MCCKDCSMDRSARLWHLEYTFPLRVYSGHERDVDAVRFHPNCNYLATASVDRTVRLWSHADAKMVRVFSGHRGGVLSLAFSPDGRLLASAGEDRRVRVWDLAAGNLLKELRGHQAAVHSLAFRSDSGLLSSGGADGTVRQWDLKRGVATNVKTADSNINSGVSGNCSPEMSACYPTGCSCITELRYSDHNTLMVAGVVTTGVPSSPSATTDKMLTVKSEDVSTVRLMNGGGGTAVASAKTQQQHQSGGAS